ncbi:CCHC-type domain-containing protein [Raphanus sativus]|nr:CCHC-type domain-containing protein [Raphanus sativus]
MASENPSSEINGTRLPPEKMSVDLLNSDKCLAAPSVETSDFPQMDCAQTSTEVGRLISESASPELAGSTSSTPQLQGAWTKPLVIAGAVGSFIMDLHNTTVENSEWPALSTKDSGRKKDQAVGVRSKVLKQSSRVDDPLTQRIKLPTDKIWFPWAARMNPQTRNLHRVTVPEYMEDGTPKVTIPDHVLLHGLQNHKEYVIGQFYRCLVPPGGLVYAVLNRLWGRKCEIFVKKLGEFSYIFHIPDEATRRFVLQRSLWHVDDCIMFVSPWTSSESLTLPEITSVPLWVTLKNIPSTLYSILVFEWIASGVGEPMLSYKPWLDPTMLGEAKIMVEVELDKPFPKKVAAWDKQGNFSLIDVEYSWLPTSCEKCGQLGHKSKRCLSISGHKAATPAAEGNDSLVAHVFESSVNASPDIQKVLEVSTRMSQEADVANRVATPSDFPTPSQAKETMSMPMVQASNSQQYILHAPVSDKSAMQKTDTSCTCDEVIDKVNSTDVNDLVSLATISVLENMYESLSVICINEKIESPPMESAPTKQQTETSVTQTSTGVCKESSRIQEVDLGSNQFASLTSLEGEEEFQLDLDESSDPIDLLTPSGKRLLRERPVKPSVKGMEWQSQSMSRGRGNRGRGNRGRLR